MLRTIKKLDIFVVKQFALLFVGTFFICQFVLMMQFLWRYVDDLIGKGLTIDVLMQFFWYMGLMLVPQALPLAILLSSLITFGNLGESSELTAIKAAGISLMQAFRSLMVLVCLIACCSYYFQDVIGPDANRKFRQLLLSMKQKSPELEIPEGIFYDGIPGSNLYVQKKDMETGKLYGIMIYRMNGGFENAAIILADSGMMQSTAEKKHLLLTLYSGEWFENMKSQDVAGQASVPYRRETFSEKKILMDFDGEFSVTEMGGINADARSKSMSKILYDLDSIRHFNDSIGRDFYKESKRHTFYLGKVNEKDSMSIVAQVDSGKVDFDSIFSSQTPDAKQRIVRNAKKAVDQTKIEMEAKGDYSFQLNRTERLHRMEAIGKLTTSLSCIIFFFIGAPLGAIIRKGGLGVPVIISVLVFIVYYIFENSGTKMARDDNWGVWFGKLISTMVLAPLAVFFTYKANNDSVVFNIDVYKNFFCKILGIRRKRHIYKKEVIITDPDYINDGTELLRITRDINDYSQRERLLKAPNPIKIFFREGDDTKIREINDNLEAVIEDLSNSKDKIILNELNSYPIMITHAHTRPFRRKWLNIITGLLIPVGVFFYLRMWRFRLRLMRDLWIIKSTNENIIKRIEDGKKVKISLEESDTPYYI